MKRRLFFWLEKLKITPEERITLTVMMAVLLTINLMDLWIAPTSAANSEQYEAIQETFEQRSAMVARQEARIMSRYNPRQPDQQSVAEPPPLASASSLSEQVDTTETDSTNREKASSTNTININTASLEQLKSLPGIGPVYAERIIAYRDSTDGFNTVGELIQINGIGDKRLEDIRPHVEIE